MDQDAIHKAMTQGLVLKKSKADHTDANGKKVKFSDFLKGTHGSDSAKWKASFKYKKALRNTQKKKK